MSSAKKLVILQIILVLLIGIPYAMYEYQNSRMDKKRARLESYGIVQVYKENYGLTIYGSEYNKFVNYFKVATSDGKVINLKRLYASREGLFSSGSKFRLTCDWWGDIYVVEDGVIVE